MTANRLDLAIQYAGDDASMRAALPSVGSAEQGLSYEPVGGAHMPNARFRAGALVESSVAPEIPSHPLSDKDCWRSIGAVALEAAAQARRLRAQPHAAASYEPDEAKDGARMDAFEAEYARRLEAQP